MYQIFYKPPPNLFTRRPNLFNFVCRHSVACALVTFSIPFNLLDFVCRHSVAAFLTTLSIFPQCRQHVLRGATVSLYLFYINLIIFMVLLTFVAF